VILLDTNALIWLEQNHPRSLPLTHTTSRLYVSPATVLELQFLLEAGRIRVRDTTVDALVSDDRWMLDDPPAVKWFTQALEFGWTRDPFDRLIAAHARLRGWRLATGDAPLAARLGARSSLVL
jgi:PIN domain nuclease of toxin-antitoxin system